MLIVFDHPFLIHHVYTKTPCAPVHVLLYLLSLLFGITFPSFPLLPFPPCYCLIVNALIFPHNSVHTFLQSLHLPVYSPFQNRLHFFRVLFSQVTFNFPHHHYFIMGPDEWSRGSSRNDRHRHCLVDSSHWPSTPPPSPSITRERMTTPCLHHRQ